MTTLIYDADRPEIMLGCWPAAAPTIQVGHEFANDDFTLNDEPVLWTVVSVLHRICRSGHRTIVRVRPAAPAVQKTPTKCETCDGTGQVHSHNPVCWACKGTGSINR